MTDRERIAELVRAAIAEINAQLPPGGRLSVAAESPLYGEGGPLDSLGLVNLIVGVEEKLQAAFGVAPNLADEALLSGPDSPFGAVGALIDHVTAAMQTAR